MALMVMTPMGIHRKAISSPTTSILQRTAGYIRFFLTRFLKSESLRPIIQKQDQVDAAMTMMPPRTVAYTKKSCRVSTCFADLEGAKATFQIQKDSLRDLPH